MDVRGKEEKEKEGRRKGEKGIQTHKLKRKKINGRKGRGKVGK